MSENNFIVRKSMKTNGLQENDGSFPDLTPSAGRYGIQTLVGEK